MNMENRDNKNPMSAHELAQKFEAQIKDTVVNKFSVPAEELSVLLEDEDGTYMSKEEANTLCSFVVGEKNGYTYLVTAEVTEDGTSLDKFKADTIS
jgi:hypothetical protein